MSPYVIQYTKTEQRIIKLLSDGMPHPREDLLECMLDPMGNYVALTSHIVRLRRKVRTLNQEIVCELRRGAIYYRQIILLQQIDESADPV